MKSSRKLLTREESSNQLKVVTEIAKRQPNWGTWR